MDDFFRDLPKSELHIHLEGSLETETLREIEPTLSAEQIQSQYSSQDFAGFIESYKWVLGLLRGPDEYALAARRLFERLAAENVRYAEVTLSVGALLWSGIEFAPVYDAVNREASRSEVEVWWIADAIRHFGAGHAMDVARLAVERAGDRIIAFGIGGDELRGPAGQFREVFRFAAGHGLHLTAHAGEIAGPESIWAALDIGAERIGHGVSAARDPALLRHLRERDIPLEICLSSNTATGAVARLADHPFPQFREAGVPMVLSTDDPAIFHTTLCREYEIAAREFHLSRADLAELAAASFRYRFQPSAGNSVTGQ